ncbi:DUF1380 family protein [Klebsiella pasteurii]|uniref:DUF1380 family protein n=1 Tax=Klebsiella pasteurii TaxID=2587529 RepID=UPI00287814ED|nr:DUF1380 family protein [Klebsiella pasteurii]WND12962.1 DUF1380 family protein [Klebsiella pasteurii]HBU6431724.1 DUF1380 family protein [Klebsiella oxytoca]
MLYGTRKELNKKLKRMFGNEERYALLVWTKEDVMAQAWNMTEAEAHTLLELFGRTGTGEHTEEGVSFRTVQALYAGIRPGIPRVSVPVDTLYRITDIAAQAINGEDEHSPSLTVDHYPSVADAQAEIAWLKREIAA